MELRKFGSSNLQVSRFGLGLAALGRPGYINLGHAEDLGKDYDVNAMEEHMHAILDNARELGIRYFDAAQSYGRAEEFLGSWLKKHHIEKEEVVAGSKWGYTYTAGWNVQAAVHEVKEHSLALLQQQWQHSKEYLSPYLRLYQIHSATLESGVLDNVKVLTALSKMKEEGIIVGISSSGTNQQEVIRKAAAIHVDGVRLFDSIQATWNLLDTSAGQALKEAHESGMGIIVKEALANGRLTNRNTEASFSKKLQFLQYKAMRLNTTVDALALAAVLAQPWADIVLSGASTVTQLYSNVRALEVKWNEELNIQLHFLQEPAMEYWENRKNLSWN